MKKSRPKSKKTSAPEIEEIDFGHGVIFRFCRIPAGTRGWVGSRTTEGLNNDTFGEEDPARLVVLEHDLWLLQTPVTQAQYRAVMAGTGRNENPSDFKGDDRPVESLSWWDALRFCNAFSRKCAGLTAAYQFKESVEYQELDQVAWNCRADSLRLPTEVEWELACRAGAVTEYFAGDGEQTLRRVGWFDSNAGNETHAVGHAPPSGGSDTPNHPHGLHDVHGNVWEWCWDAWDGDTPRLGQPPERSDSRSMRGGSSFSLAARCRSAFRFWRNPWYRVRYIGFRPCLVRSPAGIRRALTEPISDQPAGPQAGGAGGAAPEAGGTVGWSEASFAGPGRKVLPFWRRWLIRLGHIFVRRG